MFIGFLLPVFGVFFLCFKNSDKPIPEGHLIIREMIENYESIKTISFRMKKTERFKGVLSMQQSYVKLNYKPLKVYLKQELPKSGLEVLYKEGYNDNLAIVNTNGFPWVNLNLNPMGSIMRDKQHHTIFESGHAHVISILKHLENKYKTEFNGLIKNEGVVMWDQKPCWKITLTNPYFKYYDYKLKQGENLLTIAKRDMLSEHMILERNSKLVDSYTSVSSGLVLSVPNDYSPVLELFIDKNTKVPLLMKVFDEKGLYEQYEYYNIEMNPHYQSDEFDKSFSNYNF